MNTYASEQIDRLILLMQKSINDIETVNTTLTALEARLAVFEADIEYAEITTFSNSWANYDSANYYAAAYAKDAFGFVHLRGFIKDGTVGSTAFTLPVGYRPAKLSLHGVISNSDIGRVDIDATGNVTPISPSNNTWVQLDGITFYAG